MSRAARHTQEKNSLLSFLGRRTGERVSEQVVENGSIATTTTHVIYVASYIPWS